MQRAWSDTHEGKLETLVYLWDYDRPLGFHSCGLFKAKARGVRGEHLLLASLPGHIMYIHPTAADVGCQGKTQTDSPQGKREPYDQTEAQVGRVRTNQQETVGRAP